MDLDLWDCFGRKKNPSYIRGNTVAHVYKCTGRPVQMYRKSYCAYSAQVLGFGGSGVSKMLKLYMKVLHVMGKALSEELSCTWTGLISWCNRVLIFYYSEKSMIHKAI